MPLLAETLGHGAYTPHFTSPPAEGATRHAVLDHIEQQLDSFGRQFSLLGGLKLLDGPGSRMRGGVLFSILCAIHRNSNQQTHASPASEAVLLASLVCCSGGSISVLHQR